MIKTSIYGALQDANHIRIFFWNFSLTFLGLNHHPGHLVFWRVVVSQVRFHDYSKLNHPLLIGPTAYGRVANLKSESKDTSSTKREDKTQSNLVDHFTALLLAVFVEAGLLQVLILVLVLGQRLTYESVLDDSGGRQQRPGYCPKNYPPPW